MSDRQNNWPLLIGLVLAVVVHLSMVQPMRGWMIGTPGDVLRLKIDKTHAKDDPKETEEEARRRRQRELENQAKIGQLDPSTASVMRLVTWDDARKLMAHESSVDQPAIQQQVEPDPAAQQTPVDPTPPAVARPNTTQPIQPAPAMPAAAAAQPPVQQQQLQKPDVAAVAEPQPEKPTESQKPEIKPGRQAPQSLDILAMDSAHPSLPVQNKPSQAQVTAPGKIDKTFDRPDADSDKTEQSPKPVPPSQQPMTMPVQPTQVQPAQHPSPDAQQQPAVSPKHPDKPNPTVAVKSDFESEPVSEIASAEIHPGAVTSVQGIRIRTIRPRYSVVALMTAVPHDPIFRVHFSAKGVVDDVQKLRSSGYDNVDGPIVTALWKWKAEGPLSSDGLTIRQLRILLGLDQPEDGESPSDETP